MDWKTLVCSGEFWGTIATLVILIVSTIISVIKAIKNKQFGKLKEIMIGFIQDAELLTAKDGVSPVSGETKKEIVLANMSVACQNCGYKFNKEVWSTLIDTYVEFSLKVNAKQKEKQDNQQQ